eukprot:CAMPEP_0172205470 /NCGR_PEP_ID=MMETSP1050-20130122/32632_1 /TAXON_ID=233186 /ORGANISM="Cryptomonas curvata, Strain CCAP979/52" /LENGTH=70 /DNA_ID=CAMNT_0012884349 /DNA_START=159 /DNA_END=371 /DNA_ORIENTATION=-
MAQPVGAVIGLFPGTLKSSIYDLDNAYSTEHRSEQASHMKKAPPKINMAVTAMKMASFEITPPTSSLCTK